MTRARGASARARAVTASAVIVAVGVAAGSGTHAALRSTVSSGGDRIESGSVAIGDNDGASAALSFSGGLPGATDSGCIKVTYTGTLPAAVRLHGATTGTGLDQHLTLTVTRGTYAGAEPGFGSCVNFQPDPTEYLSGEGNGVLYDGTLAGYPDSHAAGVADPPAGGQEVWTTNESHVYRVEVTLEDDPAAQGKNATQSFTWEARNQ